MKTDAVGNLSRQSSFGGTRNDCGVDVKQTTDGGYVVIGVAGSGSFGTAEAHVYLVKTDADGIAPATP